MAGTIPVDDGNLSMDDLAATLTSQEQLAFEQLTVLTIDPAKPRNLATFIDQPNQVGKLAIVAKDAASQGTKILSTTAFVSGAKTDIDVYRLPLS
jgi:hypothetical protein